MQTHSILKKLVIGIFLLLFILGANLTLFDSVKGETSRTGAWADQVNYFVVDPQTAISSIKDGTIDLYSNGMPADEFSNFQYDPSIDVSQSNGLYYELTINPAVFYDTSKLNPFVNWEIREALNMLIDRNHLNESLFAGLALPKFFSIITNQPDYVRYTDKVTELETKYTYNPVQAGSIISTNMTALGASKLNGKWYYKGQPVKITLIIRNDSDGKRLPIGDYVADQLESIGFTTERLYMSSGEAAPYWVSGDPAEGAWHIYTGAWSATIIDRDEGDNFEFFMSPYSAYGSSPLWQSYEPTSEFLDIMDKLAYNKFSTMAERDMAFNRALELELEFAVRVWLIDGKNITPRRSTITLANDMAAGFSTPLWPLTIRHRETEGGTINIGGIELFMDPWNPVAGSNWAFDVDPRLATEDKALMQDPRIGLYHPQRIASAEVYVKTGLPVQKTLDWVDLFFKDTITVPDDAWVDWDAENQEFLTAVEVDPDRLDRNAIVKSVVTYPANMFTTVKWHDGSPISVADFVMTMIMNFDRTKEASAIYDETAISDLALRGIKIMSEDPLVIETYVNSYQLDAELNVRTWWPEGFYGPMPWHTTALAAVAESQELLAFSPDKAAALDVPWTNYLAGETLGIMSTTLAPLGANHKPYPNTMAAYLDDTETLLRWNNLRDWYATYGHFWVGTGAFYIDEYDWEGKSLKLTRFSEFPDLSDKWEEFQEGSIRPLATDFTQGAPGSTFTIIGEGYPPSSEATIFLNFEKVGTTMTDAEGGLMFTLIIPEGTDPGMVLVTVSVNPTYSIWLYIDPAYPVRENIELPDNIEPESITPLNQVFLPLTTK